MDFEIIGEILALEIIATGRGVHARHALNRIYGRGHGRKMKGIGLVRNRAGVMQRAEIHWYEAHGIGRRDFKIKRYVDRD